MWWMQWLTETGKQKCRLCQAWPAAAWCVRVPAVLLVCGMGPAFFLQDSSTSRVCACSQEKECPVEKTLSNSPVKSEREVLLVGKFFWWAWWWCRRSELSGIYFKVASQLPLAPSCSFGYANGGGSPGRKESLKLWWGQGFTLCISHVEILCCASFSQNHTHVKWACV